MTHRSSAEDLMFRRAYETGEIAPAAFDHRAHLRLAYVYLSELDDDTAFRAMRDALRAFLERHGIDVAKYHETLTRAWILAVRHFMAKSPGHRVRRRADLPPPRDARREDHEDPLLDRAPPLPRSPRRLRRPRPRPDPALRQLSPLANRAARCRSAPGTRPRRRRLEESLPARERV